jgi:hypothetical protein
VKYSKRKYSQNKRSAKHNNIPIIPATEKVHLKDLNPFIPNTPKINPTNATIDATKHINGIVRCSKTKNKPNTDGLMIPNIRE